MGTKKRPMKIRKPPPVETVDVEAFVASGASPNQSGVPDDQKASLAETPPANVEDASNDMGKASTTEEPAAPSSGEVQVTAAWLPAPQGRHAGKAQDRLPGSNLDHALTVFAAIGQEDVSETIARAVRTLIKREDPDVLATDGPISGLGS